MDEVVGEDAVEAEDGVEVEEADPTIGDRTPIEAAPIARMILN